MSKHTVSRIPSHVLQILRTYELVSTKTSSYRDKYINEYIKTSNSGYQHFHRSKLFRHNEYREKDFSYIERKHVGILFEKRLDLGDIESLSTQDIFTSPKTLTMEDPIYPNYFNTPKQSTDYYAKLLTLFASHYTPYVSVPPVETVINSFRWYLKLLSNTPVFFVLRQRNRLFSDSSLNQLNKPLSDLKESVRKLGNAFVSGVNDDTATRNYHLTDLATTDLLQVAIKNNERFMGIEIGTFEEIMQSINWAEYHKKSDSLIEAIAGKEIMVTDSQLNKIERDQLERLIQIQYFDKALKKAQKGRLMSFPYDIKYDELYLLTIENTILDQDHSAFLLMLEKSSDFEIIAVRLSLQHPLIYNFFRESIDLSKKPSNYTELLHAAQQPSKINNFSNFMKGLGRLSLVNVEESCDIHSMYLFPK